MKTVWMIDELSLANFNYFDTFEDFACCWIALTDTGGKRKLTKDALPRKFQHANLNIQFTSAYHIGKVSNEYIAKQIHQLPFPEKEVRIPGCFSACQLEIQIRIVERIETSGGLHKEVVSDFVNKVFDERHDDLLSSLSEDKLVVLVSDEHVPAVVLTRLTQSWSATELVHCTHPDQVEMISGSEINSVVIIVEEMLIDLEAVNMAVTRAQYEFEIIVVREKYEETKSYQLQQLITYLESVRSNRVQIDNQFMAKTPKNKSCLFPSDDDRNQLDWWEVRLKQTSRDEKSEAIKVFNSQSSSEITAAFPQLFTFPSLQSSESQSKQRTFCLKL